MFSSTCDAYSPSPSPLSHTVLCPHHVTESLTHACIPRNGLLNLSITSHVSHSHTSFTSPIIDSILQYSLTPSHSTTTRHLAWPHIAMPPARVSRPLFVALAMTMGIMFLVATRQHDSASWVPLSGASNYLKAQWSWSASKIDELETLKSFTHQPQGLTLHQPPNPYNYMWKNEAKLREVVACAAAGNCHPNALKVGLAGWVGAAADVRSDLAGLPSGWRLGSLTPVRCHRDVPLQHRRI